MKKYTKRQHEAISALLCDLDELSNKPRRLFSALREFVLAFTDESKKEYDVEVLSKIDEWEEDYYKHINSTHVLEVVGRAARDTRRELNRERYEGGRSEEEFSKFASGVNEATKKMAKSILERLVDELY
jgi:hypothetical protein